MHLSQGRNEFVCFIGSNETFDIIMSLLFIFRNEKDTQLWNLQEEEVTTHSM